MRGVKKYFTVLDVIESFRHKGLQELFEKGSSAKIQKTLVERALRRLDAIDAAKSPEALNVPGFDFHGLQGKPKRYSVHVNGPWCITFEWQGENAVKVDLETHPGAILREDVLPSLAGQSVTSFARALGISRQTLHSVLSERSGISAEMALRLGALLGNGAQLWLDMQSKYDLWQAQAKLQDVLDGMKPLKAAAAA